MTETILVEHVSKATGVTTDVSSYVTGLADYTLLAGDTKQIPSGALDFIDDVENDVTIVGLDELKISVVDSSTTTLLATALFVPEEDGDDRVGWVLKGQEYLTEIRRASGVHTGKTGTQLFKDLVDEYFPEWTYDSDSIPDVAGEDTFEDQRYSAKVIKDIFDTIAERTTRVWRVDETKKIYLISNTYTSSGLTIDGTMVHGRIVRKRNTRLWQTLVRVEGQSTETQYRKRLPVTDASETEYVLDFFPSNVSVRLASVGDDLADVSPLRGALTGSRRADDDGVEFTYSPAQRTITLTDVAPARTVGDAIYADFTLVDQLVSEQINPLAYAKYGLITGPPEVNRLLTTQADVDELAQTLADDRGEPKDLYPIDVEWDTRILPGNSVALSAQGFSGTFNSVALRIVWGSDAPQFILTLNNINYRAEDAVKKLMNRVRQLEEKETENSSFVKKPVALFGNVGLELYRVRVQEFAIGNSFTFDITDASGMFDNASRYLDGVSGGGSLTDNGFLEVQNVNDKIKLHFIDADEWDTGSSTATLVPGSARVDF